ncbi:hypothetical protein FIBSPDRAFT_730839, partial [Athelia psychrophila]
GRILAVHIDGTSNQFGQHSTNVIQLYSQIIKDDSQITYYNSGIGTYAAPSWKSLNYWKQVVDNSVDLGIAWNFEKIVINAYRWVADNFQPGDRIFLFGFSRGAYQVRALAAMIHKVGLIYKGNEEQIPFAYEVYADHNSEPPEAMSKRFKDTFSRDVRVHFVGVWDTVSSIGIVRGKNLPGTTAPDNICYFRHALALDERRVKFLPEYARGGAGPDFVPPANPNADAEGNGGSVVQSEPQNISAKPHIKETWFTGTHSDIGVPLLWMCYEAISCGLKMKLYNAKWKWDELGAVNESLTGVWKLFEYMPFTRLSYKTHEEMTMR